MKKNGVQVYALAVCFVSMVAIGTTAVFAAYSAIGTLFPSFTMSVYDRRGFESDDAYVRRNYRSADLPEPRPTGAELTARRLADFQQAILEERRSRAQDLTEQLLFVGVGAVLFIAHWKLRARLPNADDVA